MLGTVCFVKTTAGRFEEQEGVSEMKIDDLDDDDDDGDDVVE